MKDFAIETFDLTKIYRLKGKRKNLVALDNINLSIKEGEIFGLLGPNGAGKTTLIQILTTLIQPTSGYAKIWGYNILKNPKNAKLNIALMLDWKMLYNRLTAYDNLDFFCRIYEVANYKEKIFTLAKEFGLEKWLYQYVENFSSGMKIKLALCRTLLLERPILFLDEPTLGLDVHTVSFIIEKIKNLKETIFLTSHNMGVVEKICDRIAFINNGSILKVGTKDDIEHLTSLEIIIEVKITENIAQLKNELKEQDFINKIDVFKKYLHVHLKNREFYQNLLKILVKYKILKINEKDFSLEDAFLKLF